MFWMDVFARPGSGQNNAMNKKQANEHLFTLVQLMLYTALEWLYGTMKPNQSRLNAKQTMLSTGKYNIQDA